jgi:hypothetical protein
MALVANITCRLQCQRNTNAEKYVRNSFFSYSYKNNRVKNYIEDIIIPCGSQLEMFAEKNDKYLLNKGWNYFRV